MLATLRWLVHARSAVAGSTGSFVPAWRLSAGQRRGGTRAITAHLGWLLQLRWRWRRPTMSASSERVRNGIGCDLAPGRRTLWARPPRSGAGTRAQPLDAPQDLAF